MKRLAISAAALALAGTAYAAPNVAQNTQKGSLLVFPDIDTRGPHQTIVRINNDGPRDVQVKCYYHDGRKHRVDFQFELTANQPFWFDARTGDGTEHVTPYPNTPSNGFPGTTPLGAGMLACWVVDIEGINQLKWNHLYGSATIVDHDAGSAYEYTAYAFYVPTGSDLAPVGTGGTINLNGVEYDSCPLYMTAQFSPAGTVLPGPAPLRFGPTRVAFVGCNINLQQDWTPVWTKLVFDVWNEEENKVTGAWDCADTWHEVYLVTDTALPTTDAARSNFSTATVGTAAARYRVQGQSSTQCKPIVGDNAVGVGVLAIQSTDVAFAAQRNGLVEAESVPVGSTMAGIGSNLTAAGKLPTGYVKWDPGFVTPEGGVR
jgi:hypothetical protein